jgi:hypothetical protein
MKVDETKGKQHAVKTQEMRTFAPSMVAEVLP